MLFQNILLHFMLSHILFLIILSFRLNLETDSLSHKLKARGPYNRLGSYHLFSLFTLFNLSLFNWVCPIFSLFFVTRVSILTWDIYENPLSSEQTTNVIMKIGLFLHPLYDPLFNILKKGFKDKSLLSRYCLFLILFTQCSATP